MISKTISPPPCGAFSTSKPIHWLRAAILQMVIYDGTDATVLPVPDCEPSTRSSAKHKAPRGWKIHTRYDAANRVCRIYRTK